MSFPFEWNPYADQPHNVAPRKERLKHHLKHSGSYFSLVSANLKRAIPVLALYRKYRAKMYEEPVQIGDPFCLSISPVDRREEDTLVLLDELGIRNILLRIPSWEAKDLSRYETFSELLYSREKEVRLALLQNREDVLQPSRWTDFLENVFSRFHSYSSYFEIGHAWNRTKWGVWDYKEYLRLVRPAVSLAKKYQVKIIGPAVIDFEFHLYPPVLNAVSFDKISSLLYVDRTGAPERKQFGWDTPRKVALLKAIVDGTLDRTQDLWITEVNWPLKGTGKYSPASGKPNVSEEEQANYLVRYFILCLSSGLVQRVYWWQLVAPGYGLIDSREEKWRKRPSFYAMKTMVALLRGSLFLKRVPHSQAAIFLFSKEGRDFAVCWTPGKPVEYCFPRRVSSVVNRDREEIAFSGNRIEIDQSPKYVYFEKD